MECKTCEKGKVASDFYPGDSSCKECRKAKVRAYRAANIERIREYDRKRGSRQTPEYRDSWRKENSTAYKALNAVSNSLRDGKIERGDSCEECGSEDRLHGHHDDYLKPLDVRWLCAACHRAWHMKNGEGANKRALTPAAEPGILDTG